MSLQFLLDMDCSRDEPDGHSFWTHYDIALDAQTFNAAVEEALCMADTEDADEFSFHIRAVCLGGVDRTLNASRQYGLVGIGGEVYLDDYYGHDDNGEIVDFELPDDVLDRHVSR